MVEGDLRVVPLPRRSYQVVASIPYDLSTMLLRRLLGSTRTSLQAADLVVEWGFARRVTRPVPRDLEAAWWSARFELAIARRVSTRAFRPAPAVDSAHLTIRARPGMSARRVERTLWALLTAAHRMPDRSLRGVLGEFVPKRRAQRIATSTGLSPPTPAVNLTAAQWAEVARLTSDAS